MQAFSRPVFAASCRLAGVAVGALLLVSPALAGPPPPVSAAGAAEGLYLVLFEDPRAELPVHAPGLDEKGRDGRRAALRSAEALAALERVAARQATRLETMERALGRRVDPAFRYRAATNGVAVTLSPREVKRVAALPGVRAVVPDRAYTVDSDAGPAWVGAAGVWSGEALPAVAGTRGAGVVVGVLDSGVNMDHPSFSELSPDGHVFVNPLGSGSYLGWCDPAHPRHQPAYRCNDKLIGAWDFADDFGFENDGPEDGEYHGSHVAAIAVGNDLGFPPVSGVAPHAQLVAYDVCYGSPGTCRSAAIAAAIDQAVIDGVDVLNVSLGGGGSPWLAGDMDDLLRGAVAAGVTVVTSAGNAGPTAGTVGHRAPWVLSVAAASHHRLADRNYLADLTGGLAAPAALEGRSLTAGYGPAPVVDGGTCATFPPAAFAGEIVLCDASPSLFFAWAPCQRVADAGGGGCILVRADGVSPLADFHALPAIDLDDGPGSPLRSWLATGAGHTARITAAEVVTDAALGDRLASFSSRGPNPAAEILKPDLTAPGVLVLSAFRSGLIPVYRGPEFLLASGTSMASPHVAGAAALLVALHPEWTPAEVAAALVTTAAPGVTDGGVAAGPFARGAGRLDVASAAAATLVLDETDACYVAADPAGGGEPATLNVASLVDGDCAGACSWTRTVRNVSGEVMRWHASVDLPGLAASVSPASFSLPPGRSKTLQIAVAARPGAALGAWVHGTVALTADDPARPVTRLPLAALPTATAGCCLPGDRGCKGRPCDLPNPHRSRACAAID